MSHLFQSQWDLRLLIHHCVWWLLERIREPDGTVNISWLSESLITNCKLIELVFLNLSHLYQNIVSTSISGLNFNIKNPVNIKPVCQTKFIWIWLINKDVKKLMESKHKI